MSASEILIKPQAEEEQYTQSHQHHHDTASGLVFDPVAQTTMAGVVYHHHAPTESVAYANAAELVGAAAASVAAAAVEIAAMDGYGNNYSKRTLDDSTTGQEDSKRRRTLDLLDASKKVASEHWDSMFERLKAFKAQHGHCLVPKRYAADPKLGTWVETQVRNMDMSTSLAGSCLFLTSVIFCSSFTAIREYSTSAWQELQTKR